MSDNLKVAKENNARITIDPGTGESYIECWYEADFDAFLASQQAAHEAEIAKLREEIARLRNLLAQPVHSHY